MQVTIDDIARIAGVSKATVSRVINQKTDGVGKETRQRIQKLIDDLDYKPNLLARGIVTSKTKTLGVILPDITNPFFPELIKSIENYANKSGYTVIFGNTDFSLEKEQNYISTFIAKRVDGIILTSTVENASTIHERLKKYNVPCVLLDRSVKQMDYGAGVFVDNEDAIFMACEYLIRNGNKEIAFISGSLNLSTSRERLEGYTTALLQYGIPYSKRLIRYGNYTLDSGYKAILDLYNDKVSFTSVIAANDTMAIGAIRALKKLGYSVPNDIEVIGFDNIELSAMIDPPLTTIQQPTYEMGQEATKLLLLLIEGKEPETRLIRLQPSMVFRSTTKHQNQGE
jgi:LacI family transcriptional regulator